jgi:myo-inositol catabolism protein IolC
MNAPSPSRLLMLAFDHRSSFAREVTGENDPAGPEAGRVEDAKRLVFDGLLEASQAARAAPGEIGLLIDEQYGAGIPALARKAGITVAVAVERSGREVFEFEYGDEFEHHIEAVDPDYAKVLVRLNPDGDPGANELQLGRLLTLSEALSRRGRGFLFELLVPPTNAQLERCGGDRLRYERELRPALIVGAMAAVQAYGITPSLWKLEGVDEVAEAAAIVGQARSDGGAAGCLVLGAGASDERVQRWLEVAVATPGYIGFAIGRSIWRDAIRAHLDDELSREAAVASVRDRFLNFADLFLLG